MSATDPAVLNARQAAELLARGQQVGPGGWDVGLHQLDRTDVIGLERDIWASTTRRAAGLRTVRCDVVAQDLAPLRAVAE